MRDKLGMEGMEIESRLENWARWCTSSEGGKAAACMTDAICESLRRSQEGTASSTPTGAGIDAADAVKVGRAMVRLNLNQRRVLGLYYIDGERQAYIAALLRIPRHEFQPCMELAKRALEEALSGLSKNSNNKLFP